jgi:hypothetical protein
MAIGGKRGVTMKASDLDTALAIARSDTPLNVADLAVFDGYGLPDFRPIACTVEALAMLVRWECFCLDGSVDAEALEQIARLGRHRFTVLTGKAVTR